MKDEEGYEDILEFVPFSISKDYNKSMSQCKTRREQEIWDMAIVECIKLTVKDAGGFPGPQVGDMQYLLHERWDWMEDEEFMKELKQDD